jgi:hypothetical protein
MLLMENQPTFGNFKTFGIPPRVLSPMFSNNRLSETVLNVADRRFFTAGERLGEGRVSSGRRRLDYLNNRSVAALVYA